METKWKSLNNGEIVKIIQDNGKFYTLNNGNTILKDVFTNTYTMINGGEESDPGVKNWLDQPTPIRIEKPKTQQQQQPYQPVTTQPASQQPVVESISLTGTAPVDPIEFLYSATLPIPDIADALKNVNTSQMIDAPPGYGTTVKVNNPSEYQQDRPISASEKQRMIDQYNANLAGKNVAGKFIDDGVGAPVDEQAVSEFLGQGQPRRPEKTLNENGLTPEQEFNRQETIKLTGNDPFAEKIAKYRKENPVRQPIQRLINNAPIQEQNNQPQQYNQLQPYVQPSFSDPQMNQLEMILNMFERDYDINLKLTVPEKICDPKFIKFLKVKSDIIQYYAQDILAMLMNDPGKLYDSIYSQIYKEVYGKEYKKEPVKTQTKKKPTVKVKPKTEVKSTAKPKGRPKKVEKTETPINENTL